MLTSAPVRMADASFAARRSAREPQVGSDAQPAALPEGVGENTLRATILDTPGPVTGSGFAQEAGAPAARVARTPGPMTIPSVRGPKGGPETSELVPVLRDDPVVKLPPAKAQANALPNAPVATAEAVQLASYGSEAMATQGWTEISTRYRTELHGAKARIVAAQHPRMGTVYRLHATSLNASAVSLCAKLKRRGQQCLPTVLPPAGAAPG
jgi:hypothetical protein